MKLRKMVPVAVGCVAVIGIFMSAALVIPSGSHGRAPSSTVGAVVHSDAEPVEAVVDVDGRGHEGSEGPEGSEWYDMSRDQRIATMEGKFGDVEWVGDTDCFFDDEDNFWFVSYGTPYLQFTSDAVSEIGKEVIMHDALGDQAP